MYVFQYTVSCQPYDWIHVCCWIKANKFFPLWSEDSVDDTKCRSNVMSDMNKCSPIWQDFTHKVLSASSSNFWFCLQRFFLLLTSMPIIISFGTWMVSKMCELLHNEFWIFKWFLMSQMLQWELNNSTWIYHANYFQTKKQTYF